MTTLLIID
jgi:hypothetical protein